jgi:hypothetical protein
LVDASSWYFFVRGIFIRPNGGVLAKGDVVDQHEHSFDHTGILFSGSCRLRKIRPDGVKMEKVFTAPAWFLIRAEEKHEFEILADNTVLWCVYSHRFPQGEAEGVETVSDSGWSGADYEELNVRRDDVVETSVGFDAYS